MSADLLAHLDAERRYAGTDSGRGGVVREFSADSSECRIVISRLAADEVDDVIRAEMSLADDGGYTLEWKLYGHDVPAGLDERLLAAGFTAEDREQVLVLPVTDGTLASFRTQGRDIRRIHDPADLADYADIAREIGRANPEEERQQLASVLVHTPEAMSVHIVYVDGEPVACGRVYFPAGSKIAELAGGRTKTTHRRRGLFSAVVGSRLVEAHERGRTLMFTDALPTSEPILKKRGFHTVTSTQPFVYCPPSRSLSPVLDA